jgi:aryl-alcohol dehydrogenase-like predicted oxidoreductase
VARILLGTAQLGLAYGRRTTPLDEHESEAILVAAWGIGIRSFDTAETYGLAAMRLARWLHRSSRLSQAHVVTKVTTESARSAADIRSACDRFRGAHSVTLLSHGAIDGEDFLYLKGLGNELGAVVGQSVYTATEVRNAARAGAERVQAPGNIFDTRQIEAAQAVGVPLDVRSVFLQGVLLDEPEIAASRAQGAEDLAIRTRSAARASGLSPAAALIMAVMARIRRDDRVVIGMDAPRQVEEVVAAESVSPEQLRHYLGALEASMPQSKPDDRLLDPRNWERRQW